MEEPLKKLEGELPKGDGAGKWRVTLQNSAIELGVSRQHLSELRSWLKER